MSVCIHNVGGYTPAHWDASRGENVSLVMFCAERMVILLAVLSLYNNLRQ